MAPKVRDFYWCDFPVDAHLPEFWKRRPVIVIATDRTLSGAVTVVPCSSQPQPENRWAYRLATTIDGSPESWAICDKPTTVAVSRLSPAKPGRVRLPEPEFTILLRLLLAWLPTPRS
ncbi:mRNA interferase MazF [Methylobacterium sp. BE186]|uniref:type II toxin-antitoxin system PemK/MazF family toxin n=1 Tax=Methylobacterium sp. BE186 TaxID=2817715 RepID=UPI00285D0D36|nr:type II toxin-antitoxin system PemK/MazF family toxin [Methylobacterium sp. BE186]MDR7035353.1 mRNA interferase MazF [Methylobacterium sp. BE186]